MGKRLDREVLNKFTLGYIQVLKYLKFYQLMGVVYSLVDAVYSLVGVVYAFVGLVYLSVGVVYPFVGMVYFICESGLVISRQGGLMGVVKCFQQVGVELEGC